MSDPTQIAQWTNLERLGNGGNAIVYRAFDGAQEVALKVLMNKKPASEPYARFRNEIAVVRQFSNDQGVLPILDASLPERPSKDDPAWIAMPIATELQEALQTADLRQIVTAVAAVSATLARVAAEGVAHRDIKPDNLYVFEGRPVVSDFGIAHLPDPAELRLTGNRLGPFGFTPDELIENPQDAQPFPVDVFQLAKTLLVLVSGAPYPPQGHIAAGTSGALSRYVADARVEELDRLIDRCTRREPTERPTMENLSRELQAWLEDVPVSEEPNLDDLLAQFRHAHQESFDERERHDAWRTQLAEIVEEITDSALSWAWDALTKAGLQPELSGWHEHHSWVERNRFMGMEGELASDQRWILAQLGDSYFPTKIAIGVGFDVDMAGEFWCAAHVAWGDMESTATQQLQTTDATTHIESLEVPGLLRELEKDIKDMCVKMLEGLADK